MFFPKSAGAKINHLINEAPPTPTHDQIAVSCGATRVPQTFSNLLRYFFNNIKKNIYDFFVLHIQYMYAHRRKTTVVLS